MNKYTNLKGNVIALLDIYKSSIDELILLILTLSIENLSSIRNFETQNEDCKSIKSILEHVIFSGYIYTYYYSTVINKEIQRPHKTDYGNNANELVKELNKMFEHCEEFFVTNPNLIIEEINNEKKIITKWGQSYDIDQLFEHSIVHVLRHKRQVYNFLKKNK